MTRTLWQASQVKGRKSSWWQSALEQCCPRSGNAGVPISTRLQDTSNAKLRASSHTIILLSVLLFAILTPRLQCPLLSTSQRTILSHPQQWKKPTSELVQGQDATVRSMREKTNSRCGLFQFANSAMRRMLQRQGELTAFPDVAKLQSRVHSRRVPSVDER